MATDWQVKSRSRVSALTQNPFQTNDTVISVVVLLDDGNIERFDILESEEDAFSVSGTILGKWRYIVEEESKKGQESEQSLISIEDLFLSLCSNLAHSEDTAALTQVLALLLERKRILRSQGLPDKEGFREYLHVKTKQLFKIESVDLMSPRVLGLQNKLADLLSI